MSRQQFNLLKAEAFEPMAAELRSQVRSTCNEAISAAEATGNVRFFDTYSEAFAASLPDRQIVEIFTDETRSGGRTRYRKEGADLVFKTAFERYQAPGVGAQKRTVQDKLAEDVSPTPLDFWSAVEVGWHRAINRAIDAAAAKGGGRVHLPARQGSYQIVGDVVLKSRVELDFASGAIIKVANGAHNVRGIVTENFDMFATAAVATPNAPRGFNIKNGYVDCNRQNTTFDEGLYSGIGVAIYGYDFDIQGLRVYNTHGTGLCTFFDGGAVPRHAWNGRARNIYIDTTGRHGWHNRVSDIHVDDVNITMPGRNADNTWDGMLCERSVRLTNINIWTVTSESGGRYPRATMSVQTGGCDIKNVHLETGHLLLDVNGLYNEIEGYVYFGVGQAHAQVRGNFNQIQLRMSGTTFFDVFEGLRLGTAEGQAQYNQITLTGAGFKNAIVNFVNSGGYNQVRGRCFSTQDGQPIIGTPASTDEVDLLGSYNGVIKQFRKRAVSAATFAASGTTQATAPEIITEQVRVTGADGTNGVRLGKAILGREYLITNSSSSALNVYPSPGQTISGASANAPVTIPAFAVRRYVVTNTGIWTVIS